ncbi:FAD-binding protein, partial [Deltaproteobacteria bacterium]|nr:FAD-binding protein [Deltaproteobacteria bacterium]
KLSPALRKKAETDGVIVFDRIMIVDLLKSGGRVVGAVGFSMDREEIHILQAKATVLAAGNNSFKGASEMASLSGDADAMSYRAGGEITGKEFGSTSFPSLAKHTSWSRAAHGMVNPAYPVLTDINGSPLSAIHVEGEVQQEWGLGIEKLIHAGKGPFFWDTTKATDEQLEFIRKWQKDTHNPKEIEWSRQVIDPYSREKLQLAGGYAVGFSNVGSTGTFVYNTKCETILPGLFAAGDCGGTRHNGSYNTNPGLGSAPAAATGRRAGLGAAEYAKGIKDFSVDRDAVERIKKRIFHPLERNTGFAHQYVTRLLRDFMTPYFVTFIKDGKRLEAVLSLIEFIKEHLVPKIYANDNHELRMAHETDSMVLNAEMMLRASLFRTESRGVHYREDYPAADNNNWLAWTKLKDVDGVMTLEKEPVPAEWWSELMTKHLKQANGENDNVH